MPQIVAATAPAATSVHRRRRWRSLRGLDAELGWPGGRLWRAESLDAVGAELLMRSLLSGAGAWSRPGRRVSSLGSWEGSAPSVWGSTTHVNGEEHGFCSPPMRRPDLNAASLTYRVGHERQAAVPFRGRQHGRSARYGMCRRSSASRRPATDTSSKSHEKSPGVLLGLCHGVELTSSRTARKFLSQSCTASTLGRCRRGPTPRVLEGVADASCRRGSARPARPGTGHSRWPLGWPDGGAGVKGGASCSD